MEITRIFDLLDWYSEHYKKSDALAGKKNGEWVKYSTSDYINFSNYVSYFLLSRGYRKGDNIATVTNNRPEWNFADMGIMQIGVVHVPIYPTISAEEYRHILSHSDVKAIIIADQQLYNKLYGVIKTIPNIKEVFSFSEIEGILTWDQLIEEGRKYESKFADEVKKIKESIKPADLATLIYTSGTTGSSKGVMLSHNNIVTNSIATSKIQPLNHNHKVLSFLPLCHIYERMLNYHYQYLGIGIYYAENLGTIASDLKEIHADGFSTVPRLLEKIYEKMVAKGKDLPWLKKKIFFWALNLALIWDFNKANGWRYEMKLKIADKLVFSKWREALGGKVQVIISGGSALQPRLARMFWAAGMKVIEGYGLTETSPVIAVNHTVFPNIRIGTVGPILENVDVKIADDSEILTKGPNLMLGYYKDPEYTAQVIDKDGWFHTGDIGMMVEDKFLKITDRKKEIFKLSSGKYIAPQVLENKFKESIFIEQIMVVGANEKFASAIISPNFNHLHFYASKHKIHYRDNIQLCKNPEVIQRYQEEVERINRLLGEHEKIKRFQLVCEEWTPQTGELSPTLKLRRAFLSKKYEQQLGVIYKYSRSENGGGV